MDQMPNKTQNEIILLMGLPGSGKSTLAEKHAKNRKHVVIISSDKIREELYGDEATQGDNNKIFSLVRERAEEALRNCKDVIIDATNLTVKDRSAYFDIAINFDATVTGILFDIPVEECKRRNSKRNRVVPDFVYDKMIKRYEQPQLTEGFTMLIRIDKEDKVMIDNKPVYFCDPEKNESCSKKECYISGGPCSHTFNKAYEKKLTNQDKLAEIVRTMDPEILAKYIRESITCGEDCPVMGICKPKKGETCYDLIESWLKEDAE